MNSALSRLTIQKLLDVGVREFCLCAGARNAPLIAQLEKTEGVHFFSFFEERSASFFALGRIRESGRPMAVVTTSGTAVAECLPSVIEAYYQGLPLLVLSADRPRSYRGTGAPQAIEQVGIFSRYVETCVDIEREDEEIDFSSWSLRAPLHVNICFAEPRPTDQFDVLKTGESTQIKKSAFFRMTQSPILMSPVALVGPLLEDERPLVENFLETHAIPFVAEGPSSLRLKAAASRRLWAPEKSLAFGFQNRFFGSVLRLGGIPTVRFWRDLEEKYAKVPVTSCSNLDFTGLARPSRHIVGLENLMSFQVRGEPGSTVMQKDRESFEQLNQLLQKYPHSEASLVRAFASRAAADHVYLGNSLPIREWDLVAADLGATHVWANRGANGIDGQTSSFLGWSSQMGPPAWALLGDLTALYDLSAPWVTRQLEERDRRLVIVNNFGGQIFRSMFGKEIYLNRHDLRFASWAQMWGWDHVASSDAGVFDQKHSSSQVIELLPDEESTDDFTREWKAL